MPETLTWKDPACPVTVEYSPAVLEGIRRLAVEGLLSLPRVGLGVGGFLLGTRKGRIVAIQDFYPIACSYASGPSFAPTLGEMQHGKTSAKGNAASLEILGYYCSRPRVPVQITEKDRTLFTYLCPGHGQIALLIRPSTTDVSRAGLYYRKAAGTLAGGTEIPLEAMELAGEEVAELEETPPPAEAIPPPPELPPVPEALFGEPGPLAVPKFAAAAPPRKIPWPAIAGPLLVAAILIAVFTTRDQWLPRPPLELRTAETNGHFSVEWNRAAVRGLDRAVLTVVDGTARKAIPLDGHQLQAGAFAYDRQTTQFTATMDAGSVHGAATFVPPPKPALPQPPLNDPMPPDGAIPPAAQPSHP
jgi:hypothetical protein